MTAKEYLQSKYEWHRKHWNEHDHIDDDWIAIEMESYATQRVTEALEEAAEKIDKVYHNLSPVDDGARKGMDYAETIVRDLIPKQEQKQALKDLMKQDEENGMYGSRLSKEADDNQNQ